MSCDNKIIEVGIGASIRLMTLEKYGVTCKCVSEEYGKGGGVKWILDNGEHVWSRHEDILWEWIQHKPSQKKKLYITSTTDSVYCNGVECLAL